MPEDAVKQDEKDTMKLKRSKEKQTEIKRSKEKGTAGKAVSSALLSGI